MKKIALILSVFPGMLFVIALLTCVVCAIAERDLPPGSANIGLGLLALTALINLPTLAAWLIHLARRRGKSVPTDQADSAGRYAGWVLVAAGLGAAVAVGVLLTGPTDAQLRAQNTANGNQVSSIGEWEAKTRRPTFKLLDRADLPGYFVCVYDTGRGEIALCYHQKTPGTATSHSFSVLDPQGKNLQDPARWNKTYELNQPGDAYPIPGMVVPLRPDYRGDLRIEFKTNTGSGYQSVYKKLLPYHRDNG